MQSCPVSWWGTPQAEEPSTVSSPSGKVSVSEKGVVGAHCGQPVLGPPSCWIRSWAALSLKANGIACQMLCSTLCYRVTEHEPKRRARRLPHGAAVPERQGRAGRGAAPGTRKVVWVNTHKTPYPKGSPKVQGGRCSVGMKFY